MQSIHRAYDVTRHRRRSGTRLLGAFVLLGWLAARASAQAELACVDCHNPSGIPIPHVSDCRDTGCQESCHPVDLGLLRHLSGLGTPVTGDRTTTCNTCHNRPFGGVYHPFKINVSPSALTIPGVVDIDQACGQCHGGGTVQDDQHSPTAPALYRTKAVLAPVAAGMHDGPMYPVTFQYTVTPDTLTVNVDASGVDCGGICPSFTHDWDWGDGTAHGSGDPATHTYDVSGTKAITLTLYVPTIRTVGIVSRRRVGSAARSVALPPVDLAPTAAATCTWNGNTWTETVVDASNDDGPDEGAVAGDGALSVSLDWGDGTSKSLGAKADTFTHTYLRPGTFTITQKVVDSSLRTATGTCGPAAAAYFTISGRVKNRLGTANLASATVRVKAGSTIVKTLYTASDGSFSTGSVLKPGAYTLFVTKAGYTFASPAGSITVGPNSSGTIINAAAP